MRDHPDSVHWYPRGYPFVEAGAGMVAFLLLFFMSIDRTERIPEVEHIVIADGVVEWGNRKPQVWCRQVLLLGFQDGEYKTVGHRYVTDHYLPTQREDDFIFEIYVYPGVRKYKTKKIHYLIHENNDQDALFKRFPLSKQQWFQ